MERLQTTNDSRRVNCVAVVASNISSSLILQQRSRSDPPSSTPRRTSFHPERRHGAITRSPKSPGHANTHQPRAGQITISHYNSVAVVVARAFSRTGRELRGSELSSHRVCCTIQSRPAPTPPSAPTRTRRRGAQGSFCKKRRRRRKRGRRSRRRRRKVSRASLAPRSPGVVIDCIIKSVYFRGRCYRSRPSISRLGLPCALPSPLSLSPRVSLPLFVSA